VVLKSFFGVSMVLKSFLAVDMVLKSLTLENNVFARCHDVRKVYLKIRKVVAICFLVILLCSLYVNYVR
jgi:hypothetical protein